MQTTKWGKPGWCYLEAIADEYPNNPTDFDKKLYRDFFRHLANILPCIYCRQSYRQYITELPIDPWLKNRLMIRYYVYLIRNRVNDKLRKQGYLTRKNPSFAEIKVIDSNNDCYWDFFYAVAFNYPIEPKNVDRYNYKLFFGKLRYLIPSESIKNLYFECYNDDPIDNWLNSRQEVTHWLYNIHKKIITASKNGKKIGFPNYHHICQKYESFRASCSTGGLINSCRQPINSNNGITK
jgi:hypothetical protein